MREVRYALLSLIAFALIIFCACEEQRTVFYVRSDSAYEGGTILQVIDISMDSNTFQIVDGQPIILKMGIGGDADVSSPLYCETRTTMWVEISSEGCMINSFNDFYEKEYPDYTTNDKYRAEIQEHKWLYDVRNPTHYEEVEIVFPEGECYGVVNFMLWDRTNSGRSDTARLRLYYAKNSSTLMLSENFININDVS